MLPRLRHAVSCFRPRAAIARWRAGSHRLALPPTTWLRLWSAGFGLVLLGSLVATGVGRGAWLNPGGWALVQRFLRAGLTPDLSPEFLRLTLTATLETLSFAVCGLALSLLAGSLLGLGSSEVWWRALGWRGWAAPWLLLRGLLAVPRALHEVIWGLLAIQVFGLDPLVAVLAIALPFSAIIAKVYADILDETPRAPLEALLASGAPPLSAISYGLLPPALPSLIAYACYRFECALRASAVLGLVGAGGLGYQLLLSSQALRYEQMWTLLLALIALAGSTDLVSGLLRRALGAPSRLALRSSPLPPADGPLGRRSLPRLALVLAGLALLPLAFAAAGADGSRLLAPESARRGLELARQLWPPEVGDGAELGRQTLQTLAMSVLAITLASAGGLLLALPAARTVVRPGGWLPGSAAASWTGRLGSGLVLAIARIALLVARAVPEPLWALLLLFVLFPGVLPGAIALGLHNGGILGRLLAEAIEDLPPRPAQALAAAGATRAQVVAYAVLPALLPRALAYSLYRWEVCLRATVVVGLVGAGGLGRRLTEDLSSLDYNRVAGTLLALILLTLAGDLASQMARRTLR